MNDSVSILQEWRNTTCDMNTTSGILVIIWLEPVDVELSYQICPFSCPVKVTPQ